MTEPRRNKGADAVPKLSANLGFLWTELALPDAIRAAAAAGFDAVECHWPYATPAGETAAALRAAGLPMLGLNTVRGDMAAGENGLAALPGREAEARAAIDEAVAYAAEVGARHVHVMAGNAAGAEARALFLGNLAHAARRAEEAGVGIVIEPLNARDAPGYFLRTTDQAVSILHELDAPAVRLMFDCYHVALTEGRVTERLEALWPLVGHVQAASVPDRGPPDRGELDYREVFALLDRLGYAGAVGAEYRPGGPTEASLGWMESVAGRAPVSRLPSGPP